MIGLREKKKGIAQSVWMLLNAITYGALKVAGECTCVNAYVSERDRATYGHIFACVYIT